METSQNQQIIDHEHLKLLSIFHYVLAGIAAFFACIPIIHVIIGLFLILAPHQFGPGNQQPPVFVGLLFVFLGGFIILAGWTYAVLVFFAGKFIARRTNYTYCFVVACVECIYVPFGTVLGVFSIIVLSRPGVKAMFAGKPGG
jgi:hypothetical protein